MQKSNLFINIELWMQMFPDSIPDEESFEHEKDGTWPFHNIVEQLILDIFDPGKFLLLDLLY